MIGVWRDCSRRRIIRAVSKPSIPGMRTSRRITARLCLSTARNASSPDCARNRFCPSGSSNASSASRFLGSSSTIRMSAFQFSMREPAQGKVDPCDAA